MLAAEGLLGSEPEQPPLFVDPGAVPLRLHGVASSEIDQSFCLSTIEPFHEKTSPDQENGAGGCRPARTASMATLL